MSLLFIMLSRLVITFLPRNKRIFISWLQSPSAVILEHPEIKSARVSTVSSSICHEVMGPGGSGISLGPDPNGRGSIVATQGRTQPGLGWLLFLGRELLRRESQSQGPVSAPPPPFQTGMVSDDRGV